mmetsp:Transcript_30634/g.81909  ORF Transcript_30634/g.81909 Transcript_30634/m.81909 type:complete len:760 (+) Transcript_30634:1841-4120(+)
MEGRVHQRLVRVPQPHVGLCGRGDGVGALVREHRRVRRSALPRPHLEGDHAGLGSDAPLLLQRPRAPRHRDRVDAGAAARDVGGGEHVVELVAAAHRVAARPVRLALARDGAVGRLAPRLAEALLRGDDGARVRVVAARHERPRHGAQTGPEVVLRLHRAGRDGGAGGGGLDEVADGLAGVVAVHGPRRAPDAHQVLRHLPDARRGGALCGEHQVGRDGGEGGLQQAAELVAHVHRHHRPVHDVHHQLLGRHVLQPHCHARAADGQRVGPEVHAEVLGVAVHRPAPDRRLVDARGGDEEGGDDGALRHEHVHAAPVVEVLDLGSQLVAHLEDGGAAAHVGEERDGGVRRESEPHLDGVELAVAGAARRVRRRQEPHLAGVEGEADGRGRVEEEGLLEQEGVVALGPEARQRGQQRRQREHKQPPHLVVPCALRGEDMEAAAVVDGVEVQLGEVAAQRAVPRADAAVGRVRRRQRQQAQRHAHGHGHHEVGPRPVAHAVSLAGAEVGLVGGAVEGLAGGADVEGRLAQPDHALARPAARRGAPAALLVAVAVEAVCVLAALQRAHHGVDEHRRGARRLRLARHAVLPHAGQQLQARRVVLAARAVLGALAVAAVVVCRDGERGVAQVAVEGVQEHARHRKVQLGHLAPDGGGGVAGVEVLGVVDERPRRGEVDRRRPLALEADGDGDVAAAREAAREAVVHVHVVHRQRLAVGGGDGGAARRQARGVCIEGRALEHAAVGALEQAVAHVVGAADDALLEL